jgi:hypothetical protein
VVEEVLVSGEYKVVLLLDELEDIPGIHPDIERLALPNQFVNPDVFKSRLKKPPFCLCRFVLLCFGI